MPLESSRAEAINSITENWMESGLVFALTVRIPRVAEKWNQPLAHFSTLQFCTLFAADPTSFHYSWPLLQLLSCSIWHSVLLACAQRECFSWRYFSISRELRAGLFLRPSYKERTIVIKWWLLLQTTLHHWEKVISFIEKILQHSSLFFFFHSLCFV